MNRGIPPDADPNADTLALGRPRSGTKLVLAGLVKGQRGSDSRLIGTCILSEGCLSKRRQQPADTYFYKRAF